MEKHREPRNKLCIYGQLIFEKGAKVIQCELPLQQMVLEQLDTHM